MVDDLFCSRLRKGGCSTGISLIADNLKTQARNNGNPLNFVPYATLKHKNWELKLAQSFSNEDHRLVTLSWTLAVEY